MLDDEIDFGVHVEEEDDEEREVVCNEYVYMKSYQLIGSGALDFIDTVHYNLLLRSSVSGDLPSCFHQKSTGIKSISAKDTVNDADQFLRFLKSQSFLRDLI